MAARTSVAKGDSSKSSQERHDDLVILKEERELEHVTRKNKLELVTAGAWEFIRIGVFLFALLGASGVIPWTGPLSPASILFAMAGLWVGRKTKEAEVGRWWNHER